MKTNPALTDVNTLRARARRHMEGGAVTAGYTADERADLLADGPTGSKRPNR
jgi:hypothetical protein